MKRPFTVEQFLKVFEKYNHAVWPIQLVLILFAVIAIFLAIKRKPYSPKIITVILSFFWLWMGIVYHLLFFSVINKAAYAFGAFFILQGILFFNAGILQKKFSFGIRNDIFGITGIILVVFALVIYPLIGYYLGHTYPSSPTFGLPCPTTIFTFGMLLWMKEICPIYIVMIPLLWSLFGFSAAFSLGIKEDTGLLVAGIISTVLILIRNRRIKVLNLA